MSFIKYNYGAYEKDIKRKIRKRLDLKDKIRYHNHKAQTLELKVLETESQIQDLLKLAKGIL